MEAGRSAFKILTGNLQEKTYAEMRKEYQMYLKEVVRETRLIRFRIGIIRELSECDIDPQVS